MERLVRLLSVAPKIPRVVGAHVSTMKVPHESLNLVTLVVDLPCEKVF